MPAKSKARPEYALAGSLIRNRVAWIWTLYPNIGCKHEHLKWHLYHYTKCLCFLIYVPTLCFSYFKFDWHLYIFFFLALEKQNLFEIPILMHESVISNIETFLVAWLIYIHSILGFIFLFLWMLGNFCLMSHIMGLDLVIVRHFCIFIKYLIFPQWWNECPGKNSIHSF